MASRTRLAACCETACSDSVRKRPLLEDGFSAREGCNLCIADCRSMPSNTRRAPSTLPLWYSNFPRRDLASCKFKPWRHLKYITFEPELSLTSHALYYQYQNSNRQNEPISLKVDSWSYKGLKSIFMNEEIKMGSKNELHLKMKMEKK